MTQRYCESCGNLFDASSTAGVTPPGKYLCPSCATKEAGKEDDSEAPAGESVMDKGAGLKKSVEAGEDEKDVKLTFRCPGCNALLSSRKIDKRSRLTCPKCNEKVILNPDGTSELLSKPSPHMKKMDIPDKKEFTDQDLERLLDFGETQPITKDSGQAAPTPRPPSGRKTPAPAPQNPASPKSEEEEREEKLRFLDQVQGPGGKRPAAAPKTLDSEIPSRPKQKAPPSRKKLTRFGTDRQKSDSVEDRLEAAKRKRAAIRNNILAVIFIVLPILVGVGAYYAASKKAENKEEESGFGKLIKDVGTRIKPGLIAIGKDILKQEPVEPKEAPPEVKPDEQQDKEDGDATGGDEDFLPKDDEETPDKPEETPAEKPEETPVEEVPEKPAETPEKPAETPEKPAETPEKPAETPEKPAEIPEKPADTPEKPAETPEKPAEIPEKPAETPEKPAETPEKPADTPEKPAETPEKPAETPEKPEKVEFKKCPKCGRPAKIDALKCPWCPYEYPPPKKEEEPKKEEGAKTH